MLEVEQLVCKKPYHKDCDWIYAKIRYPEGQYLLLKQVLEREVKKTGTAYRIVHSTLGVLTTIKKGHDGELFVKEDEDALRAFALGNVMR